MLLTMHTILNIIDSVIKYLIRFSFFINNDNNDTNIKKPKSTNKCYINMPIFTFNILIINPLIKLDIIKNVSTG